MKLLIMMNDGTIIIRNAVDISNIHLHSDRITLIYNSEERAEVYKVEDISTVLILK